jgi:outer membrane protein assembly factor BamA
MFKKALHIFFFFCLFLVQTKLIAQKGDTTFVEAQLKMDSVPHVDFRVRNIIIEGNKKTKPQIIQRELLFKSGDSIVAAQWGQLRTQSAKNLFNTSLFNRVEVGVRNMHNGEGDVVIRVVERWYIWPIPVLEIDERNFNTWWETKDFSRLSAGVFLTHNNFRGRREELKLLVMGGYNQKFGISYTAPYVNKKKTIGVGFYGIYTLRHEVNYKTAYDKQQYLKLEDEPIQRDLLASTHVSFRPNYFFTAFVQLRYRQYEFADSLLDVNPDYAPTDKGHLQYFAAYAKLKLDHRDYRSYPLDGYYVDAEMYQYGFGILNDDLNIWRFQSSSRLYLTISPRWYFATGFTFKLSGGMSDQPYLFNRALGYGRDIVRDYQYYVIEGEHFALLKNNIKFALVRPRKVKLNFIKTEKFNTIPYAFYLNVYFDAGYVDARYPGTTNELPNEFLFGSGIGLDFVTYYDAVARFEFGLNRQGDTGFFLSFIAPI